MHEANKELEEKYIAADNRYDGIQSHSKQLEVSFVVFTPTVCAGRSKLS
jgi:hypothetical protein